MPRRPRRGSARVRGSGAMRGEDGDPEEMRGTVENGGGGGWQGLLDSR
jgi:hypothetical protein